MSRVKGDFRYAFFKRIANLLSFDDLRRMFLAVLARTCVSEVVARTPQGLFTLDVRDRIISWSIIARGSWEPEESKVLGSLLRPGDVAIDGGANIGWHTIMFANKVGGTGRVLAVEPDPGNFRLLEQNVRQNGHAHVSAYNLALTEARGPVSLVLNNENFGDHHLRFGEPLGEQGVTVQGVPLDDLTADFDHIRLLKLDCQGSEPAIIRGAAKTLRKCDFVVSEYWPAGIERAGFSPQAYLDTFKPVFRRFRRVREGCETFQPISELDRDAAMITGEEGRNDATDYLFER